MRRLSVIIVWSLLLLAVTTMLLPSCGITGKGRSRITPEQADSIAAGQDSMRKSFFEEFGDEDFQPLPSGWNRPTLSERKAIKDTTFTAPLEIIPTDTTEGVSPSDSTSVRPETARPSRPSRPVETQAETETEMEEGEVESAAGEQQEKTGTKKVDYIADIMRPINFTDDSTAFYFLGNVVFYHNGAVITCDSAIRFSEKHMEFYKRVVINSGTTFVYGDRVEYNGEVNLARVYAPIVKMVDQDAVLYTYNFSYNTLTERGRYWGGGTVTQNDNQMESLRGYYNTQTREFTGAGEVEIINPDYQMISDSVRYNLNTEVAEFFTPTQIWNAKGEILLSDRGKYRAPSEDYEFTKNSYILTESQEIWADSMEYFSLDDNTVMRRDVQIIDEENNTMAFGDYGEYWGEIEYGFLTIEPSLISYDPENPADTLYMRSDSMFFYTYPYDQVFEGLANAAPVDRSREFEELMERPVPLGEDGLPIDPDTEEALEDAETQETTDIASEGEESEINNGDDTEADEGPPDDDSPVKQDKASKRQEKRDRKAAKKAGSSTLVQQPESETEESQADPVEELPAEEAIEVIESDVFDQQKSERIADEIEEEEGTGPEVIQPVYESPYGELIGKLHRLVAADSVQQAMTAEQFWIYVRDEVKSDSMVMDYYAYAVEEALMSGEIDSAEITVPTGDLQTIIETVFEESRLISASKPAVVIPQETEPSDSVQRVFYGYYNVRIFRDDFQAVCDSIVGFSKDSTLHMHIDPVLWSEQNQVVSDVMILFTRDEQLYKAEFYGSPFMSSEVDSLENQFNQIKGKFMTSWFRDNEIYRHDVQGNGQTYYYMEDDKTGEVQGFMVCESADITFYIEERQIDEIIWKGEPDYVIYPIDMISADVDQILPGFKWEAHRRPRSKEEVHTRYIRPRQREEVLALPQPTFPLTEKMEQRKEQLTQQNMWRDRNDTLAPHAVEFVHDMELKYGEQAE